MNNISFPNLGLDFSINPVAFSIGSLQVYWYGIITALAFLVIILGILRSSDKYGIKQDDLVDLVLITSIIGIICARIFYVLVNWDRYRNNLSEIYKIWGGGLAIYGGIIGGIITIYLFCRKRKISALQILDHLVVYFALGQAIGRWGNFVNQELFGPNTNLPWAMTGNVIQNTIARFPENFPGVDAYLPVHPLFLYESLWDFLTFTLLATFRKRKKMEGEVFSLYMISYGLARFTIDSMRFDLKVGNFNINRVIGLIFAIAFGVIFIARRLRKNEDLIEEADEGTTPSIYREILHGMDNQSSAADDEVANEGTISDSVDEAVIEGSVSSDRDETENEANASDIDDESTGYEDQEGAKQASVSDSEDEAVNPETDGSIDIVENENAD